VSITPRNYKVDAYLNRLQSWRAELEALRSLLLESPLNEDVKWGKPCYSLPCGNVAILYAFKDAAAVGFFKGILLDDKDGILTKPGENSQAMRMAKFTNVGQVKAAEGALRDCIRQAIEIEISGREVSFKNPAETNLPEELQKRLESQPALKAAFEALTPGRRRGYALYFSGAKQAKTREARIEKCVSRILAGKGLNDPFDTENDR
jgi:uncharacterized protein YdeI (YjbR/CyaY-like superfamily)